MKKLDDFLDWFADLDITTQVLWVVVGFSLFVWFSTFYGGPQ